MALTVPAGESTASLSFQLLDDKQVEPRNEFIYFEITGISDSNLSASLVNSTYSFEIKDHDVPPIDGLQVDLSWNVGEA